MMVSRFARLVLAALCLAFAGCARLAPLPRVAWGLRDAPRWASNIVGRRVVDRTTGQVWIVKSAEAQPSQEPWHYLRGRQQDLGFDRSRYYAETPASTVFALASADGDEAHPACRSNAEFRRAFRVRPRL